MKRIAVAIEVADEDIDAQSIRADMAEDYGVRTVLNSAYADKLVLVVPEPDDNGNLPLVRLGSLTQALKKFGIVVAIPSAVDDALADTSAGTDDDDDDDELEMPVRRELRSMFREFKSNPLHSVSLRGKDPTDPDKRARKLRAKRFKEGFYERLAEFIADHPSLSYRDYWDADGRPYEKQWPEYRAAVKMAKAIRANREAEHDALYYAG